MPDPDIATLRNTISKLNQRYDELKDFSLTVSVSKKLELLDQLDLLNIKITRMESVLNQLEAAAITVSPPSDDDKEELTEAMNALSQEVARDMQWSALVKLTKSFMTAARTISNNITVRTSG